MFCFLYFNFAFIKDITIFLTYRIYHIEFVVRSHLIRNFSIILNFLKYIFIDNLKSNYRRRFSLAFENNQYGIIVLFDSLLIIFDKNIFLNLKKKILANTEA